ncbi:MAG: IS3 family transposase [Candidatus Izemoplasmatales bacterium]|nr:IS3 family transposase [Candidatus Izemoplasmatales bacterium]
MKYGIIDELSPRYNISSLCAQMEVSRSGYYKWLGRKGVLNPYQKNREDLKALIIPIHESHKTYGYRNIAQNIRNVTGWMFSDWLCHQCCKELHIRSEARDRFNAPGGEHEIFPNLLNGDYTASRPFEKVCTDTTILHHHGKTYDWNLYVDLVDNSIIAYDLRLGQHGSGVKNHFMALSRFLQEKQKRGYNDLVTILHSDQGSIYTSRAFNARLHYTIRRSMSRRATPTDNPVIEAINGWIKDELKADFNLEKADDIHKAIREYVKYYNTIRLACALKYKSPLQYRSELGFQ